MMARREHCWIERFKIKDFEGGGDGGDDGGGLTRFEILGRKHESEEYCSTCISTEWTRKCFGRKVT